MLRTGTFVQVAPEIDGVGKLLEVRGAKAEIEYFISPAGFQVHHVAAPTKNVREVELSPQTRVFCFDPNRSAWRPGRVDSGLISAEALHDSEDHYHVRFPNGRQEFIPVSRLFLRWAHPIQDPTDYLAHRVTDTPFFFDGRSRVVRYLSQQRAAFGGLTALASSAIDLLPHQVALVRRVLADPIERYLLADEVGLGKTVEAGILIRQHVLDCPRDALILVVVPPHLVEQWRSELATKFSLLSERVTVVADEALEHEAASASWSMLVVDEAHRASQRAFGPNLRDRPLFERLRVLARRVPRLLLLSGTPVLHQEDGFLAMLHLLDPECYPLEDREAFRRRVRDRQTIAETIADLEDNATPLFVEEAVVRLAELFQDDDRLMQLCGETRTALRRDSGEDDRVRALRSLRTHVTETYRLHRRLLRTRREDPRVRDHLPRRNGALLIQYDDHARAEAFDFVEAWRLAATTMQTTKPDLRASELLFATWVEAALSHPRVLARCIEARLALKSRDLIPSSELEVFASAWCFEGERELLQERLALLIASVERDDRTIRLADWLSAHREIAKVIVFVDNSEVADIVASTLRRAIPGGTVLRYCAGGQTACEFENNDAARVLVCDASAEEGLNLQRVGAAVVHYDLPLAPARIEQRIGRIDRIEARGRMRNIVFSSDQPYEREWVAYLAETVRVFDRSVAPLQYVLLDSTARIRTHLSVDGAAAIEAEGSRMRDPKSGIEAELRQIGAQEALDSVECDPERDETFFESVTSADDAAEDDGRRAFDSWVVERLHFNQRSEGSAIRYVHDVRRPTLVPLVETVSRFAMCIDRNGDARRSRTELPLLPLTFERGAAERNPRLGLVRVGHPFVEALEGLVRADDRGAAFAMWRYIPAHRLAPRLYFRFDFLVEADIGPAREIAESQATSVAALRRRADEAFPVEYRTIWLDSDLEVVGHDDVLALLSLPYSKRREDGGTDTNLRPDRWPKADVLVPVGDWDSLCIRARNTAEHVLRNESCFLDRSQRHAQLFRHAGRSIADALRSRIARLSGRTREAEEQAAAFEMELTEALAAGVESPSLRVDSVGAIFLSGKPWPE